MGEGVTLPATGFPHNDSFIFVHKVTRPELKGPGGDPKRSDPVRLTSEPSLPILYVTSASTILRISFFFK